MENPTRMDDLGVPLFSETPIYIHINIIAILQNILLHDLRFPIQQPARAADVEQLQLHVPSEKKARLNMSRFQPQPKNLTGLIYLLVW